MFLQISQEIQVYLYSNKTQLALISPDKFLYEWNDNTHPSTIANK